MDSFTVMQTRSPHEASAWVEELTPTDPVRWSVMASVTASCLQDPDRFPEGRWFAVHDARGRLVLAAMHTHPRMAHLPVPAAGAVEALAAHLAAPGQPAIPRVSGDREAAEGFARAWCAARGTRQALVEGHGVYDLPVPATLPFPVDGEMAVAADDGGTRDLLTTWNLGFHEDVGQPADRAAAQATIRRHLAARTARLWLERGQPVAMAWVSPPAVGVVRVSGVYTPPDQRGHGYASGLVHALSAEQQALGHTPMLYTQLANPTSNKIYQAIGYRRVGDAVTIDLDA